MLIVAGSTSPEEIEATKQAFSNYYTDFQIEAVSIERGVYEVLRDRGETRTSL
jgi:non-canonical (house-cleaning) NTP pyrophosphatase